jgi:hypothetical protein
MCGNRLVSGLHRRPTITFDAYSPNVSFWDEAIKVEAGGSALMHCAINPAGGDVSV